MVKTVQGTGQVWVNLGQKPWNRQVWYVAPVAKAQIIILLCSSTEDPFSHTWDHC